MRKNALIKSKLYYVYSNGIKVNRNSIIGKDFVQWKPKNKKWPIFGFHLGIDDKNYPLDCKYIRGEQEILRFQKYLDNNNIKWDPDHQNDYFNKHYLGFCTWLDDIDYMGTLRDYYNS